MAHDISTLAGSGPEVQDNLRAVSLAQKTELVGQIATAIAHQFNNIMMAVSSYAEVELKKAAPSQRRSLEQVLANAARATSLVQKLLAFNSKHSPSPKPLELGGITSELSGLLQQLLGDNVELTTKFTPDLPAIEADPIELEQMILSLALHVRRSIVAAGRVRIAAKSLDLDNKFFGPAEGMPSGKYVVLSIASEPLPATTSTRSSSPDGNLQDHLALMAVRGMVKEARGIVRVFSSPLNGSTFEIYFPALSGEGERAPQLDPARKGLNAAKTILVVEDDDAVRVPAAEFLMMEGFKVLQAKTGPEALQIAERQSIRIDLLITDMFMPEMSGREVGDELVKRFPGLKVLYMSGAADKTAGMLSGKAASHQILQKPFRLNVLQTRIGELMAE
ncbi:MAG TPA: response regulator [Terriglobales bacterium]|jgi:two-component system cell cycle sensor histidine kinase/response regulator CckA